MIGAPAQIPRLDLDYSLPLLVSGARICLDAFVFVESAAGRAGSVSDARTCGRVRCKQLESVRASPLFTLSDHRCVRTGNSDWFYQGSIQKKR
jgi:hypothetical protein